MENKNCKIIAFIIAAKDIKHKNKFCKTCQYLH